MNASRAPSRRACFGSAAALAFAVTSSAGAQDLAAICRAASRVTVGQWASYDVAGELEAARMRIAIIGSERRGDTTLYWLETNHSSPDPNRNAILQVLLADFGTATPAVRAIVLKFGTGPVQHMSDQMVQSLGAGMVQDPAIDVVARCATAPVVGWETVTVPAGALRALHTKDKDGGDLWLSADVPFGLVRQQEKGQGGLMLTGYGSDAKSSIVEPSPQPDAAPH